MAAFGWSLLYLRHFHDLVMGMDLVFYLLAVVWGTDIGAYIIGRVMGGPKLAPQISPGKTWAGVWGGLGVAGLAAVGFCLYEGVPLATKPLFLAFGLSGASQIGDLFESYVKRRAGVKESGGLIPGHGGILDRIDGLVFASILLMLFQMAGGNLISW